MTARTRRHCARPDQRDAPGTGVGRRRCPAIPWGWVHTPDPSPGWQRPPRKTAGVPGPPRPAARWCAAGAHPAAAGRRATPGPRPEIRGRQRETPGPARPQDGLPPRRRAHPRCSETSWCPTACPRRCPAHMARSPGPWPRWPQPVHPGRATPPPPAAARRCGCGERCVQTAPG